jgi:hypothetical protein
MQCHTFDCPDDVETSPSRQREGLVMLRSHQHAMAPTPKIAAHVT